MAVAIIRKVTVWLLLWWRGGSEDRNISFCKPALLLLLTIENHFERISYHTSVLRLENVTSPFIFKGRSSLIPLEDDKGGLSTTDDKVGLFGLSKS